MALRSPQWRRYARYKPRAPRTGSVMLAILVCQCYLLFFHGLGNVGLIGPDEPRYYSVAREMWLSGDFITPRLHGNAWFEKPPLMYWGAALATGLAGESEWAARFPSALGALASVLAIFMVGRRLYGTSTGFVAAVILASSAGYFSFARAASMDMPLTACLTLGLCALLAGLNTQADKPARRWWFYAFYAALGLGVLAKGPVAIVLPALVIVAHRIWAPDGSGWKKWHPEGLLIAAAISLPWHIWCAAANGREFIDVYIINHNLQRFTSEVHGHSRPVYFYAPVLLFLTFPWTFFLIPALRRGLGSNEKLMLLWSAITIGFFSLSGSKLPGYILPAIPPIALLMARGIPSFSKGTIRLPAWIQAGLVLFIGVALGLFGSMVNLNPHVNQSIVFGVALVLAVLIGLCGLLPPRFLIGLNALSITMLVVFTVHAVFPSADKSETMRPWRSALSGLIPEDREVLMYRPDRWAEFGLQHYRFGNARAVPGPDQLIDAVGEGRALCVAAERELAEISEIKGLEIEVVRTIDKQSAMWVWKGKP